jgi:hypothetical protein
VISYSIQAPPVRVTHRPPALGPAFKYRCKPGVRVFRRQVPGTRYRVPAIRHLGPGTRHRSRSDAGGRTPSTEDRARLPENAHIGHARYGMQDGGPILPPVSLMYVFPARSSVLGIRPPASIRYRPLGLRCQAPGAWHTVPDI